MSPSRHVTVRIDLGRIRRNVEEIARKTGVRIIAVVKADAYGLGARRVVAAIGDLVDAFCVFTLREAIEAKLWETTGKPALALGLPETLDPKPWIQQHVQPCVWTVSQAAALREAQPIVCVDTGMQRFSCPPAELDAVIEAGGCQEAITHATTARQAQQLQAMLRNRRLRLHAAATALLDQPEARLDAVRPGLAMYRGAVKVSTPLVEVHDSTGPAGYTGFTTPRHGVILCGYSNGLRIGPCSIHGMRRRVLEVGMQSAFVEIGPQDKVGDEVILLGEGLSEADVAAAWACSAQEAMLRLCGTGVREYV